MSKTLLVTLVSISCVVANDQVCYEAIGCFSPLEDTSFPLLPQSPTEVQTTFRLYNGSDPKRFSAIHYKRDLHSLKVPDRSKVVIVIHGWIVHQDFNIYKRLRNALFTVYDWLVAVDWREGASKIYPQSLANIAVVGREVAELIHKLHSCCKVSPQNVHIVGFSLGAHAAGNAGRWYAEKFGQKIYRISALDGAGVLLKNSSLRLTSADASFVDVIHTSGGDDHEVFSGKLGYPHSIGHVDFYPNGGREQPHCLKDPQKNGGVFCSHHAAIELYISSLKGCKYFATKCDSWNTFKDGRCKSIELPARMGYFCDRFSKGDFYLATNDEEPFCETTYKAQSYSWSATLMQWFQTAREVVFGKK